MTNPNTVIQDAEKLYDILKAKYIRAGLQHEKAELLYELFGSLITHAKGLEEKLTQAHRYRKKMVEAIQHRDTLRKAVIKYLQGRPILSPQSPLYWDMKLREEMEQAIQDIDK